MAACPARVILVRHVLLIIVISEVHYQLFQGSYNLAYTLSLASDMLFRPYNIKQAVIVRHHINFWTGFYPGHDIK